MNKYLKNLEDYHKVDGYLKQIEDIGKLSIEIYHFREKFIMPINLGVFYHLPWKIQLELSIICDKMTAEFDKLVKIEQDKIENI